MRSKAARTSSGVSMPSHSADVGLVGHVGRADLEHHRVAEPLGRRDRVLGARRPAAAW